MLTALHFSSPLFLSEYLLRANFMMGAMPDAIDIFFKDKLDKCPATKV